MQNTARNATLSDLAALLTEQHARKIDVVANAAAIRSEGGVIVVHGTEPVLTDDGVTSADGRYQPTTVFDEGVSDKLGIPLAYVRRMREERPDLYDANVNGWLHGSDADPADPRRFLVRAFRGDDGGTGVARALLSDTYRRIDNLDVLVAALDGVRSTGVPVEVEGCDLSDRNMHVRISAPSVQALAPVLLDGYRSPFTGASGADNPVVWAGLVVRNSEVGAGAFTITPRLVVRVCKNGLTIQKDALRSVHLGGRMDEGVVSWGDDTQQKALELVTLRARDAVRTFLDAGYVERTLKALEAEHTTPLVQVQPTIEHVSKKLGFTQAVQAGVLDHFIRGGMPTAGGVLAAVTSYAQDVDDPDLAAELEASGIRAMELAAAHSVHLARV